MPKDTLVEERMFGLLLKMPLKKDFYTAIQVESIRKEILERFGFSELTQVQGYMECRIANSWVKCLKAE